ncbi:MAG: VWA domain-containing protein [Chloroflexota bacterium]|nr:VWA domain-containing protein [Chloroflexota bacterium]
MVESQDQTPERSLLDSVEFAENPEPRCACLLVLDVSTSMTGEPLQELSKGLSFFKSCIEDDTLASLRAEIGIVTFNHEASLVHDFTTVDEFNPPALTAAGGTRISSGINLALDMIEERKETYRANGITYYRPWVWLICDGRPEHDEPGDWDAARDRVKQAENDRQVNFFTVGVGGAAMDELDTIGNRRAVKLQGLNFQEMFAWLSSSMSSVSQSQPSDTVALSSPDSWAQGWDSV